MGRINNYQNDTSVSIYDKVICTDAEDNNKTKNILIGDILDLVSSPSQGPMGPQGNAGPTGPQGPAGPAGLNWQGDWLSGETYVVDDAVGYGGASYFCISGTSGTTIPSADTDHWALLASQGAIGPAGPAGPQGPQGPAGADAVATIPPKTIGFIEASTLPFPVLIYDTNLVYENGGLYRLPDLTQDDIGKKITCLLYTSDAADE